MFWPKLYLAATHRDRYSKIAKQVKRRREREPSRLSVRKILRSMKKRKARCKLKVIVRKSTPKSSRLYSLATDYKFWYVRYLNRSSCFFSNFVNVNRVIANRLLRKSKRASNSSLANHKKKQNQVAVLKAFVCQEWSSWHQVILN